MSQLNRQKNGGRDVPDVCGRRFGGILTRRRAPFNPRLELRTATANERNDKQDQKHDEADLRDGRCSSCDDTETEYTGNKSNDEKYNSVA